MLSHMRLISKWATEFEVTSSVSVLSYVSFKKYVWTMIFSRNKIFYGSLLYLYITPYFIFLCEKFSTISISLNGYQYTKTSMIVGFPSKQLCLQVRVIYGLYHHLWPMLHLQVIKLIDEQCSPRSFSFMTDVNLTSYHTNYLES